MNRYKLAKRCVKNLKKKQLKITTAESITGGMIAESLISIPGSSKVIKEGYITYSDEAKSKILKIDINIIKEYNVVSQKVASLMATSARIISNSNYALASTGVAGPDTDEYNTKVGTVYIACASDKHIVVRHYNFTGNRNSIRNKSTICALSLLSYMLQKEL